MCYLPDLVGVPISMPLARGWQFISTLNKNEMGAAHHSQPQNNAVTLSRATLHFSTGTQLQSNYFDTPK